ncbi:prolyl 4-hydroxylase [Cytophagales bacterium WSM2-2]|nr:prolyl 4-hydroxylase [Cytophagales bacterium WSM2-2]
MNFFIRDNLADMKNISSISWQEVTTNLNEKGFAHIPGLLSPEECDLLIASYSQSIYRSVINMQRYRFGSGEYKYFSYPLPSLVQSLREQIYPQLATIANSWSQLLGLENKFPSSHSEFILHCNSHQQERPTPLILHYQKGGFNTLHQDLYGDVYFPFQVVIVLSQKGRDYEGGELIMTEQLPRAQSKANVLTPGQGDAIVFTTNFRPVKGTRGYYRSRMKHGVSEVISGERYALGIIFHDAS